MRMDAHIDGFDLYFSDDEKKLVEGCANGDLPAVRALIEKDTDIDVCRGLPLLTALEKGNYEIVNFLIANGANIVPVSGQFVHIFGNDEKKTIELFKQGQITEQVLSAGLSRASGKGYTELVKMLVEADIDIYDDALVSAAENGHHEIVDILTKTGDNVSKNYALMAASSNGHHKAVEILLKAGANVHVHADWSLMMASGNGHYKTVEVLLNAGADVHERNDWSLIMASGNGHYKTVKLLINAGANICVNRCYPLKCALENEYHKTAKLLFNAECLMK